MELGLPVLGYYEYTLDKKNRLFVPAKHREALGNTLVIGPSFMDASLTVFSVEDWNDIYLKVREMEEQDQYAMEQNFFTLCDTYTPDEQGRITLNAQHVKLGSLSGTVIIQGVGHRAKIWSKDRYAEMGAGTGTGSLKELAQKGKF